VNTGVYCASFVDDDGFILSHIRDRIEVLAGKGGNVRDFASQFAARCGLTLGQFEVFLQGDLSVPPERARRIEAALDAVEDRGDDPNLGDLDGLTPAVAAAIRDIMGEDHRDEVDHQAEPEPVDLVIEHQVEEEAVAAEPATVEPEPVEPVESSLDDAIGEAEGDALVAEPEPVEFEPPPPRSRTKAKPSKSSGSHDLSRDKRAASAVAAIVTKPKPRSMSSTRGQLATLRQEARRRLPALQNATKTRSDRMLRQLAGREAEVVAWWLAYAYARVLYGPDATQLQIAETKVDLDAAADPDAPKAKPNRRQAQTAIERTHRLEARGMPWQRYVTHGVREFREIFGRSAASELAPPLHRPDPVRN